MDTKRVQQQVDEEIADWILSKLEAVEVYPQNPEGIRVFFDEAL